jgi:membrane associated rhomboid family serine protease
LGRLRQRGVKGGRDGEDDVIPLGISAAPQRVRPVVTALLALLIVGVFARVVLLRDAPLAPFCSDLDESAEAVRRAAGTVQAFVCQYGAIPDELAHGHHVHAYFTATFVHVGWFHALTNLLFLAAFAPRVEEDLGHTGLLVLFVAAGALATEAHVRLVPHLVTPAVGASGAVAAVLGAHLVLAPRATLRVLAGPFPLRLPSWFVIVVWAVLQSAYTTVALRRAEYPVASAYDVHVAGFVIGAACVDAAALLRPDLRRWRPDDRPAGRSSAP